MKHPSRNSLFAVLLLCWFACVPANHAASIALQPVADTTLFEPSPNNKIGRAHV